LLFLFVSWVIWVIPIIYIFFTAKETQRNKQIKQNSPADTLSFLPNR